MFSRNRPSRRRKEERRLGHASQEQSCSAKFVLRRQPVRAARHNAKLTPQISSLFAIYQSPDRQYCLSGLWSRRRDLNSRPLGPEPSALPSCATPRRFHIISNTPVFGKRFLLNKKNPRRLLRRARGGILRTYACLNALILYYQTVNLASVFLFIILIYDYEILDRGGVIFDNIKQVFYIVTKRIYIWVMQSKSKT